MQQELVGFSADGSKLLTLSMRLVSSGGDEFDRFSGPLMLWNLQKGTSEQFRVDGDDPEAVVAESQSGHWRGFRQRHDKAIGRVVLAPDGKHVAYEYWEAGGGADSLRFFNLMKGKELLRIDEPRMDRTVFSPDSKWLITVVRAPESSKGDWSFHLLETCTGKEVSLPDQGCYDGGCFSPHSRYLAFAADPYRGPCLWIWNLLESRIERTLPGWGTPVGFSPDSRKLVAQKDAGAAILELLTNDIVPLQGKLNELDEPDVAVFHHSGDRVFLYQDYPGFVDGIGPERPLNLLGQWDVRTGQELRRFPRDAWLIQSLERHVVEMPRYLMKRTSGPEWIITDGATGQDIGTWPLPNAPDACSPDGRFIMTGDTILLEPSALWRWLVNIVPGLPALEAKEVTFIHDAQSLKEVAVLTDQSPGMFSPNGQLLATHESGPTPVITIWDLPPRKPIFRPLAWSLLASLFVTLVDCWFVSRKRGQAAA